MGDALSAEIDIATAYEELFVEAMFREWSTRMLDAARVGPGDRVLDVACGTGIVARTALARVAPGGSVAGLDLNAGMLAVAARVAPEVDWHEGTAEALPFDDGAFDAVVSQFGLMVFDDPRRALVEMQRVLRPGGHLAVATWDSLERTPAYQAMVDLLERVAGSEAAGALRAPFGMGDRNALAAVVAAAGLEGATIATETGTARFASLRAMVEADLRARLPIMGVNLPEEQVEHIIAEANEILPPFAIGGDGFAFAVSAHIVTATVA